MKTVLGGACTTVVWLYASLMTLWFVLTSWLGDAVWWLALLNVFTLYLFLPLVFVLPACLVFRRRSFWTSVVPPVFIFLLLYGPFFLPTRSVVTTADQTPLTIMTFNIWGYSRSKETARAIVDNGTPDIVALQELAPEMARVLAEELGNLYPYRAMNTSTWDNGLGVLSRYPLTDLDSSRFSEMGLRVRVLHVTVNDRTVTFYNVHLPSSNVLLHLEEGSSLIDGIQTSFQAREALIQQLMDDIATRPGPVIVTGDFNSTDQSDVYAILTRTLTDTHRAAGQGFGHTFPAYGGSFRGIPIIPRQVRIDMIFHSEELVALSSSVRATNSESDHLPVLAQLAWR